MISECLYNGKENDDGFRMGRTGWKKFFLHIHGFEDSLKTFFSVSPLKKKEKKRSVLSYLKLTNPVDGVSE